MAIIGILPAKRKSPRGGFLTNPVFGKDKELDEMVAKEGSTLVTIGTIGAWYFSNIGVLLLNKYLLTFYGYKYPIFLTMLHMIACAAFSYVAIAWMRVVPMQVTTLSSVPVVVFFFRSAQCGFRLTRNLLKRSSVLRASSFVSCHCSFAAATGGCCDRVILWRYA